MGGVRVSPDARRAAGHGSHRVTWAVRVAASSFLDTVQRLSSGGTDSDWPKERATAIHRNYGHAIKMAAQYLHKSFHSSFSMYTLLMFSAILSALVRSRPPTSSVTWVALCAHMSQCSS